MCRNGCAKRLSWRVYPAGHTGGHVGPWSVPAAALERGRSCRPLTPCGGHWRLPPEHGRGAARAGRTPSLRANQRYILIVTLSLTVKGSSLPAFISTW
jgi:hypothetical protein